MFLDAHVQIATIFVSVIKLRATMKKKIGHLVSCMCFEYLSNETTLYLKFNTK